MAYCIVETIEDGEILCTAVPHCWINEDEKILKWPGKSNYFKCLKNLTKPAEDWEICKISRVLSRSIGKKISKFKYIVFHINYIY